MAVCSPVCVSEWFGIKSSLLQQAQAYIYSQLLKSWSQTGIDNLAWVAQNCQHICLQNRHLSIYLSSFAFTYMTYGMSLNVKVIKYKVASVHTDHSTKPSSCFHFLNCLAVAKNLKTICQLKECKELVE